MKAAWEAWKSTQPTLSTNRTAPEFKEGLAFLDRVCRDLGRDTITLNELEAHPDYLRRTNTPAREVGGIFLESEGPRGQWDNEMRNAVETVITPGAQFLTMLFNATGEPYLSAAIVRAHGIDGRFWRHAVRRVEGSVWGEPEREGCVEHVLHELRLAGWKPGQHMPHGLRNSAFCRVVERLKIPACSFEAAVADVEKSFNEARARGFKPPPFRHTAVIGIITIRVLPDRRVLDPTDWSVVPVGTSQNVPNSTFWRRVLHQGDAVLVG